MYKWKVSILAWPYSTGEGQAADQKAAGNRVQEFEVDAEDMAEAFRAAKLLVKGMKTNPRLWMAPIVSIVCKDLCEPSQESED